MKELTEKLKRRNLKVTPQRLAIYQMLVETVEHPNAETIYKSLEENFPSMSLATVYKTLDALTSAELVQELNVGEDSYRYDANVTSHPHLVCRKCSHVLDYFHPEGSKELMKLKKSISQSMDFSIENEQIYFYGTCSLCKE